MTIDPGTGKTLAALRKQPLAHLEIHQPACAADLRISVNREEPVSAAGLDPANAFVSVRKKDRVSYLVAEEQLAIDLTQVSQQESSRSAPQIRHEVEVEVKAPLEKFLGDALGSNLLLSVTRELSRLLH